MPFADNRRSNSFPFSPVAPVTRIMVRLLLGLSQGWRRFGSGGSDNASMDKNDTMDFPVLGRILKSQRNTLLEVMPWRRRNQR
jgi:hypothetical protein